MTDTSARAAAIVITTPHSSGPGTGPLSQELAPTVRPRTSDGLVPPPTGPRRFRSASRERFPDLALLGVPDALRHHFEQGPDRLGVADREVAEAPFGEHQAVQLRLSGRSEEHTSELQSHVNLVCRLLLEKKKK